MRISTDRSTFFFGMAISNQGRSDKLDSSIQTEGNRVRGTTKLKTPQDFLGKIEFQAIFDTTILLGTGVKGGK